jgi:hypothetical protein
VLKRHDFDFCNRSFKIKHKLYVASGSAPPIPVKYFGGRTCPQVSGVGGITSVSSRRLTRTTLPLTACGLVSYLRANLANKSCSFRTVLSVLSVLVSPYTGCHLLGVQFIRSLKLNVWAALTRYNTTGNNIIKSHAQHTTVLQSNLFLTGIHCSQFNNKQQMHYIIKYCSISPTYVSVPVEPSSGGQSYIHITSIN